MAVQKAVTSQLIADSRIWKDAELRSSRVHPAIMDISKGVFDSQHRECFKNDFLIQQTTVQNHSQAPTVLRHKESRTAILEVTLLKNFVE
jgi:hypothetical protein